MKVLEKIPTMSDSELSVLFANTIEFIYQGKQLDLAEKVKKAIQLEWMNREEAFQQGDYKADNPQTGVLKTIGYKVGNEGVEAEKRKALIDYLLSEQLPPVGSPAHMAEWGLPSSKERYRKSHRVIQVLLSSARTIGNMDKAANEWEEDLRYMESRWGYLKV